MPRNPALAHTQSMSGAARSVLDLPYAEREHAVRLRYGADPVTLEQVLDKLEILEALHDPLLGPATEEQLAALVLTDPSPQSHGLFPARYAVKRLIGRGRYGDVYEADDRQTTGVVALKVIRGSLIDGVCWPDVQREIERGQRACNVNIVPVLDAACFPQSDGPDFYIAMPLVRDARTIIEWSSRSRVSHEAKLDAVLQVCDAIHAAHSVGVLHGDLSPHNVLVDGSDQVRLVDFGLARELSSAADKTVHTPPAGTPSCMAPEQAECGTTLSASADVFSIGALMFAMFSQSTLRDIPPNATPREVLDIVRHQRPDFSKLSNRGCPNDLRAVIARCLAHDPNERFQSAREAGQIIRAIRGKHAVSFEGFRPRRFYRASRFAARRPALLAATAATIMTGLALAGGVGSVIGTWRAERVAAQAAAQRHDVAQAIKVILENVQASGRPQLEILEGIRQSLDVMSGGDPKAYATLSRSLALVHWVLGDHPGAIRARRQGWLYCKGSLGPTHPVTANMLTELTDGLYHIGAFAELLDLADDQSIRLFSAELGADSGTVRSLIRSRAVALSMSGDHDAAIGSLQALHAREMSLYGGSIGGDKLAIRTMEYLGEALLEGGRPEEAESILRETVDTGVAAWGRPDAGLWVSEWIDAHGRALLAVGKAAAAEAAFQQAYAQRLQALGPTNVETLRSLRGVVTAQWMLARNEMDRTSAVYMMKNVIATAEGLGVTGNELYLATHRLVLAEMLAGSDAATVQELQDAYALVHAALAFFEQSCGPTATRTRDARALQDAIRRRLGENR